MPTHLPHDDLQQYVCRNQPVTRQPETSPSSDIQSVMREIGRLRWQVRALYGVIAALACIAPLGWLKAEGKSMVDVDEISADKINCTELAVGNGKGALILLSLTDEGAMISMHRKSDPAHREDENYVSWSVEDIGGKASMIFTDSKQAERMTIREEKSGKFGFFWKDGKGKQVKSLTE